MPKRQPAIGGHALDSIHLLTLPGLTALAEGRNKHWNRHDVARFREYLGEAKRMTRNEVMAVLYPGNPTVLMGYGKHNRPIHQGLQQLRNVLGRRLIIAGGTPLISEDQHQLIEIFQHVRWSLQSRNFHIDPVLTKSYAYGEGPKTTIPFGAQWMNTTYGLVDKTHIETHLSLEDRRHRATFLKEDAPYLQSTFDRVTYQ